MNKEKSHYLSRNNTLLFGKKKVLSTLLIQMVICKGAEILQANGVCMKYLNI